MSMQREHRWSAYLDGELSASEAAEFDESLTLEEQQRLQAEVRFEGALGEFLSQGGECPNDVWHRATKALARKGGRIPWWMPTRHAATFVAAAAVMLIVAGVVYRVQFATPAFLSLANGDYPTAESRLALNTGDLSEVNEYLHTHGIALVLHAPSKHYHVHGARGRELRGASEASYKGETVTEIMFECCGRPLKVVIVPKTGPAAGAVRRAIERDQVQEFRSIGDYVAVTVGRHPAHGLLDLLSDESGDPLLDA